MVTLCLSRSITLELLGVFLASSSKDWTDELLLDFLGDGEESEWVAAAARKREARVVLIGTEVEAVLRFSSEEDLRCSVASSDSDRPAAFLVRLE